MRFLIDESAGVSVAQFLRQEGHDVLAVAEAARRLSDSDILDWAVKEDRIIVTNDKDFGDLIYRSGKTHSGVILLRLRDESASNKVSVLADAIHKYSDRLPGKLTVLSEGKMRVRWEPRQSSGRENE